MKFADLKETVVEYARLFVNSKRGWKVLSGCEPNEAVDSLNTILDFGPWDVQTESGETESIVGWRLHMLNGTICLEKFRNSEIPWAFDRSIGARCFLSALLEHQLYKSAFAIMVDQIRETKLHVDFIHENGIPKRRSNILRNLIPLCISHGLVNALNSIINYNWKRLFLDNTPMISNISFETFDIYGYMYKYIDELIEESIESNQPECTAVLLRWKNDNVFISEEGDMML